MYVLFRSHEHFGSFVVTYRISLAAIRVTRRIVVLVTIVGSTLDRIHVEIHDIAPLGGSYRPVDGATLIPVGEDIDVVGTRGNAIDYSVGLISNIILRVVVRNGLGILDYAVFHEEDSQALDVVCPARDRYGRRLRSIRGRGFFEGQRDT